MKLYKYMPIVNPSNADSSKAKKDNEKRLESIIDDKFWFAKPVNLNDPFDCKPEFKKAKGFGEVEKILQELNDDELIYLIEHLPGTYTRNDVIERYRRLYSYKSIAIPLLHNFAQNIAQLRMSNIGVLSLTETNSNCLMWTHYAKNHSGICVRYEIPENTNGLHKVQYRQRQPKLSIHQAFSEKAGKLLEMLYTKNKHWKYENEWRIARLEGDRLYGIKEAQAVDIYFGINTSAATKRYVRKRLGDKFSYVDMLLDRDFKLRERS